MMRDRIRSWLDQTAVPVVVPETLPTDLYADASHPLTDGYDLLARRLAQDASYRQWLARPALSRP
jgi:hypothetical protein